MSDNQQWPPSPDSYPAGQPGGPPGPPPPVGGYGPPMGGPVYPASPQAPSPSPAPRSTGLLMTIVAALLAGAVGGAGSFFLLQGGDGGGGRVEPLPQAEVDDSPPAEGSIAAVVAEVLPVVVTLEVAEGNVGVSGSGFIIDNDGHILTNNHVVSSAAEGGASIRVILSDRSSEVGHLVGRNASYDLAVVKIDRQGLTAAALGNSDNVNVGDTAIAIGAPLELSETVTQGIISALNRPVTAGGQGELAFINAIQTDAAINPGNSGGPLLTGRGEVVAVNSAIATVAGLREESGSIGLGFAIPINQAKRIAEEIIATGTSTTPVIGVTLDLTYNGNGARISSVEPGGPADEAGLVVGDVIVAVDGEPVADSTEFIVSLRSNAPGDTVELALADGSTVQVTLAGRAES